MSVVFAESEQFRWFPVDANRHAARFVILARLHVSVRGHKVSTNALGTRTTLPQAKTHDYGII